MSEALKRALLHLERAAIRMHDGHYATYHQLLANSLLLSKELETVLKTPLRSGPANKEAPKYVRYPEIKRGARVALMVPNGPGYMEATWATWLRGGICVPIGLTHTARDIDHVLRDSGASVVLATRAYRDRLAHVARDTGTRILLVDEIGSVEASPHQLDSAAMERAVTSLPHHEPYVGSPGDVAALLIYTSGTTGRPKGVLHSQGGLLAQCHSMIDLWQWSDTDLMLHTLPLHHIHGIVNGLYAPLVAGATVEFQNGFKPDTVWARLIMGHAATVQHEESTAGWGQPAAPNAPRPVTVFMGVPTMYSRMISHYESLPVPKQAEARKAAASLRLTVSGSSACPVPTLERWRSLANNTAYPLERYGMTEIGMALSNPYAPAGDRRPGTVGVPMPGVEARVAAREEGEGGEALTSSSSSTAPPSASGEGGELLVRTKGVFVEYWGLPDKTTEAFDGEGYFRTGDTASVSGDPPYYRILGRTSVDILKSRGYKLSALEIEGVLLEHPGISECAVLGLDDPELGQKVAAIITGSEGAPPLQPEALRSWALERMPKYAVPEVWLVKDKIPRNAMGKVNKVELVELFAKVKA